MKSVLFCCVILFSTSLVNGSRDEMISSQEATYDGSKLKLLGKVVLDHSFGKMIAEEAELDKAQENSEFPFSTIYLKNQVEVSLPTHGKLSCDEAKLDFNALTATFLEKSGEGISYKEVFENTKRSLLIKAPMAHMKMGFGADKKMGEAYFVDKIETEGAAEIHFNEAFILHAPKATYKTGSVPSKQFQGEITASAIGDTKCIVHHGEDLVEARYMQIDLASDLLALGEVQGTLKELYDRAQVTFRADKVFWNEKKDEIKFQGHVECVDSALGKCTAEKEMWALFKNSEGKKVLYLLKAKGQAHLSIHDGKNENKHELFCSNTIDIDHENLNAILKASDKEPLIYKHQAGTIYAGAAKINYSLVDNEVVPVSAELKGGIKMVSSNEKKPKFCLADRLSTSFQTQSMVLYADPGKRVLYWDKAQGLTISAAEVHITKDLETEQEEVRGVGSVRFTFDDAEKEVFKKFLSNMGY